MSEPRRLAFVRLLISGMMNDPLGQLAALRDLGALPDDTDLQAVATVQLVVGVVNHVGG